MRVAIYSRRVAELSERQAEALCVCPVRFLRVWLSHTCPRNEDTEKRQKKNTKAPFPVTDRPDTMEIGCSHLGDAR